MLCDLQNLKLVQELKRKFKFKLTKFYFLLRYLRTPKRFELLTVFNTQDPLCDQLVGTFATSKQKSFRVDRVN